MSSTSVDTRGEAAATAGPPPAADAGHTPRRWWTLAVIGLAQLMVVLDATIVNIALPSAQRELGFSNDGRQWVITAYSLAFGSLLLLGGRLADLVGRRVTFLVGLVGFGAASALGGAADSFTVLVVARAVQGLFGAVLAPSGLSLLTTTFTDPKERSKAFGIFGAIAGSGAAIGLLLGGVLTEHLDWRWTLYVNVVIAVVAVLGAVAFLRHASRPANRPRLDLLGTVLVGGGLFCLVFGFSNADTKGWRSDQSWGFLVASGVLLALFVAWQAKAKQPLLPLRVLADRNRAGSFVSVFLSGAGMFGISLFLTYYLQGTLGYSPVRTGLAFLPMVGMLMVVAQIATNLLVPRIGPKPVVPVGMALAGGGLVWLSRLGLESHYAPDVLGPLMLIGAGLGLVMPPAMSLATLGIAARDQGVASATVNTMQQVGGSVGTALFNTVAATAATDYAESHLRTRQLAAHAAVHSYSVAYLFAAVFFAAGLVLTLLLYRGGRPPQLARGAATAPGDQAGAQAPADTLPLPEPAPLPARHPAPEPAFAAAPAGAPAPAPGPIPTPVPEAEPTGAGVRGRVLAEDGSPVLQAAVTLIDLSGRQLGRAAAADDGGYRVQAPRGGSYVLVGSAPGHQPHVTTLALDDTVVDFDLVLPGGGGLAGTVRAAGRPVAGALVVATDERGEVAMSAVTDDEGGYRMTALMPGAYTVTVSAQGHQPSAEPLTLVDNQLARYDVDLGYAATLRGTVRGPEGKALQDARVALLDAAGNVIRQHITGDDGAYAFADLSDGDYTVVASGYPPVTCAVRLTGESWEEYDVLLGQEEWNA